jgi:uncharacterized membrane protein HdeD (DUF308 family)
MSSFASSAPMYTSVELQAIRRHWVWFALLGAAMVGLGAFIVGWSCLATVTFTVTWVFGCMLIASGILELFSSIAAGRWTGTLVHLLVGVLYTVVGIAIVDNPALSALVLTRIIAVFLVIGSLFRLLSAIIYRYDGWMWTLISGAITLMLGIMIYREWPVSGLWFIGLCVGIDLILNGWTWLMLALTMRRLEPAA